MTRPTGVRDDNKFMARGGLTRPQVKACVRERDGYRCVRCGMTAKQHMKQYGRILEVHRTQPGSLYTVEGCVTLCAGCHGGEPKRSPGVPDAEGPSQPRKAFHAPEELFAALERYINDTKPQPSDAAVLRAALEGFLKERGYWPPKEPKE